MTVTLDSLADLARVCADSEGDTAVRASRALDSIIADLDDDEKADLLMQAAEELGRRL